MAQSVGDGCVQRQKSSTIWGQLGVLNRVLNVAVTQIRLQGARVVAFIGQREAATCAELSRRTSALYRPSKAGRGERRPALEGVWSRNSAWRLCEGMEKPRIIALRQAQLCGYLIDRTDRLYCPGGSHPLCSVQTAQEMISLPMRWRRDALPQAQSVQRGRAA